MKRPAKPHPARPAAKLAKLRDQIDELIKGTAEIAHLSMDAMRSRSPDTFGEEDPALVLVSMMESLEQLIRLDAFLADRMQEMRITMPNIDSNQRH
jgi:hypothetical protein